MFEGKTLSQLAYAYCEAKMEESNAASKRRDLAKAIQALTGHSKEGQSTYEDDTVKVTVKAPLIRSMDWAKWDEVRDQITEDLWPVQMKPVLDEAGVKWLEANHPEAFAVVCQAMTIKPGAVQITIKSSKKGDFDGV